MLYNMPTAVQECNAMSCSDLMHGYMVLTPTQKKAWIRAAGKANCIRLAAVPGDIHAMQINVWDSNAGDFTRCAWTDQDHFDS